LRNFNEAVLDFATLNAGKLHFPPYLQVNMDALGL